MEIKRQVKTYEIDYICDDCGIGKMRSNGIVLTTYPAQYPHVCDNCGKTMVFIGKTYPETVYEYADME